MGLISTFLNDCVILLPIAVTFYFTWWFIHFFSPNLLTHLGINMFGLGFFDIHHIHLPGWCIHVLMA